MRLEAAVKQEDRYVSDQYSVFDDEDQVQPASKAPKRTETAAAAAAGTAGVQTVTMTVAALIGVVALLLGVIIGVVIPVGVGGTPTPPSATGTPGGAPAPQLSPEQLQGELPAGHPDLSGMEGGSTGTSETTGQ